MPQLLERVAAAPYAAPEPRTCEELERQIAELDGLLGADVDVEGAGGQDLVGGWARGALRDLIPYRGVLRFVTGASKKEKALAGAILASSVRRGYLKGVRETLACHGAGATDVVYMPE